MYTFKKTKKHTINDTYSMHEKFTDRMFRKFSYFVLNSQKSSLP